MLTGILPKSFTNNILESMLSIYSDTTLLTVMVEWVNPFIPLATKNVPKILVTLLLDLKKIYDCRVD